MLAGQKHSEATRLLMSRSRIGKPAHNKGRRGIVCFRGHLKNKPGTCRECLKQMPKRIRWHKENSWKQRGMKDIDGSWFNLIAYDRLYQVQQGRCKICQMHQSELKRVFDVDHNHITGIVRGLLCHGCNMKVGSFESPLAAAIKKYLGE